MSYCTVSREMRDQLMTRKYHTNMYTDVAYRFIKSLMNAISYDNRRGIGYYTGISAGVEREPDNEIVIFFNDTSSSSWYKEQRFFKSAFYKKHTEFLNWLGWYGIRKFKDRYSKDWIKTNWKRTNFSKLSRGLFQIYDEISEELSISDIYLIYDSLRGRAKKLNGYLDSQKERIFGAALDPITAELERARRDEIVSLNNEYEKKVAEIRKKYDKLRSDLYQEEEKMKNAVKDELKKKIDDLNNSVKLAACLTD